MKPEGFIRGAAIMTVAGLVSRALGAFYRPIVTRLFAQYDGHHGEFGIGLTNVPASIYLVILSITSIGINIAISRLIAERVSLNDYGGALRVFRVSIWLMAGLGLVLSVGFFLAGSWLANLAGYPEATPGFYAIAPAILIVSVMCTFRGFFQGLQQMAPTGISQVLEQLTRIGTGIVLVAALAPMAVNLGAAGFNFGAVTSALVSLIYLLYRFFRGPYQELVRLAAASPAPAADEAPWSIVKKLLVLAGPISLLGSMINLVLLTDAMLVKVRLEQTGITGDAAVALFGQLTNAISFVNLPMILASAFFVTLVPAVTEAVTTGRLEQARHRATTAFRLTAMVGIPASVGLFVAAPHIYGLLFPSELGGSVLRAVAWATLFLMVLQTAAGVLQGMGKVLLPARNFLLGLGIKAVLTYWWTALPQFGVQGAAYATVVGFAVAALLNLWAVSQHLGVRYSVAEMVWQPALASLLMAAAIWWTAPKAVALIGHVKLGNLLTLLVGGAVYAVALPLLGGVRMGDLERLGRPGQRLAAWVRRVRE